MLLALCPRQAGHARATSSSSIRLACSREPDQVTPASGASSFAAGGLLKLAKHWVGPDADAPTDVGSARAQGPGFQAGNTTVVSSSAARASSSPMKIEPLLLMEGRE